MKQTAIQQAIVIVRSRMESMNETLMGKHTSHHLQQIERGLYDLLEKEKEQRIMDYNAGHADGLCNHINDADNYINEQNYLKDEDSNQVL
jgi:hypothetical protein